MTKSAVCVSLTCHFCSHDCIIVIATNKSRNLSKTQIVRRICDAHATTLCWAYSAEVARCGSTARHFPCRNVYKQVKSDSKTHILCALLCFCVCVFCRMCTVQICGILMSVPSLRITIMQICSVQMTLLAIRTSISQDHIRAHQGNCGSSLKMIPPPVLLTPIHPIMRYL